MMQPVPFSPRGRRAPAMVAKLVTGAALLALLSGGLAQPAAAQDDTIVLTAGGSTLTVSPGHADAVSAVAEAHAEPGFAETIAAGARAVADSDCGAMTEASAALAIARPDAGALTQAEGGAVLGEDGGSADESLAVSDPEAFAEQLTAEILAENEALQMIAGDQGDDGASDPVQAVASDQKDGKEIRKITPENCPKEEKDAPPVYEEPVYEEPVYEAPVVYEVPSTGTGATVASLASLFGAASAAAAFGAVALRKRDEAEQIVAATFSARR